MSPKLPYRQTLFNEIHKTAATLLHAAEESLCRGRSRDARKNAQAVLACNGVDAYFPAAKLVLKRCKAKRGTTGA